MGYYLNENGYICYVKSGYPLSDTHGGRSEMHRREQEEVVNEIVDKKLEYAMVAIKETITQTVNAYAAEVWTGLISSLKGSGEMYGLSVSTRNNSFGTSLAISMDFLAVLYVILPANDI